MGGSGGSQPNTDVNADTGALQSELSGLRDPNSQQNRAIQGMIGGNLPDSVNNAFAMQQKASQVGIEGARTAASQSVRGNAAARGLFSSDIAIGAEGQALAGVENQFAQQSANIFGQQANTIQQGILSGLQFGQQNQSMRGNLAGQISNLNTQAGFQQSQLEQQQYQANQQQGLGFGQIAGGLVGSLWGQPALGAKVGGSL